LRERLVLKQLTAKSGVLISTGGGVVCNEENRAILRSRGFVVYLKTSINNQLRRLSKDKSRPLLQAEDRTHRLQELAQVRNPLYDATADLVFSTRNSSVYQTAKALSHVIRQRLDTLKQDQVHADG